jgi:hypothetical protein
VTTTPTLPRILAGAAACAVLLVAAAIAGAPDASAHAGGRAQLYIERFRMQPAPAGWEVQVTLVDADSGRPEPGCAVSVTGSGPSGTSFGPTDLTDPTNRGRYSGAVPATPGQWTILVNAHDLPGGPAAVAVSKRYEVRLTPGQVSDPGQPATVATAHHSPPAPLARLAGLVLTGACVIAALRLARTRRRPAPSPRPINEGNALR